MKARMGVVATPVMGISALACSGSAPTAPDVGTEAVLAQGDTGSFSTSTADKKTPISGTLDFVGLGAGPIREFVTPSGIAHFWELEVITIFDGSIQGQVTFTESGNNHPNGISYRGPFEGEVEWNGATGTISGMWTTLCTFPEGVVSCGGTFNAKGSGDLRGVNFHIVWGPGFYPFNYTGHAIDNRK
jgi:hypothetical protein